MWIERSVAINIVLILCGFSIVFICFIVFICLFVQSCFFSGPFRVCVFIQNEFLLHLLSDVKKKKKKMLVEDWHHNFGSSIFCCFDSHHDL